MRFTDAPVQITYRGQTTTGRILMTCMHGLSMILTLDSPLEPFTGIMPIIWSNDRFVDLDSGDTVLLDLLELPAGFDHWDQVADKWREPWAYFVRHCGNRPGLKEAPSPRPKVYSFDEVLRKI